MLISSSAWGQDLLLPEWDYEASEGTSVVTRFAGEAAEATYSFANDTISDTWSITKSPLGWKTRGWLTFAAVGGATVGLVYLADGEIRDQARGSHAFKNFGDIIRPLGTGPGIVALTGGFLASGYFFDRPKEQRTARLLLEASAIGSGFSTGFKFAFGRSRPRTNRGPQQYESFSGELSMPSGETTNAFIMAGVVTSQYPQWPVQIAAYSLAAAVGAGRIALDEHWSSDVFLSAALGIAISKAVAYFNRARDEERQGLEKEPSADRPDRSRHLVQVSTRSVRWTYVF